MLTASILVLSGSQIELGKLGFRLMPMASLKADLLYFIYKLRMIYVGQGSKHPVNTKAGYVKCGM